MSFNWLLAFYCFHTLFFDVGNWPSIITFIWLHSVSLPESDDSLFQFVLVFLLFTLFGHRYVTFLLKKIKLGVAPSITKRRALFNTFIYTQYNNKIYFTTIGNDIGNNVFLSFCFNLNSVIDVQPIFDDKFSFFFFVDFFTNAHNCVKKNVYTNIRTDISQERMLLKQKECCWNKKKKIYWKWFFFIASFDVCTL